MNRKKLVSVKVVFNNSDSLIIPYEYIGVLQFDSVMGGDLFTSEFFTSKLLVSIDRNYISSTDEYTAYAMDWLRDLKNILYVECIYEDRRGRIYIDWFKPVLYEKGDGGKVYDPQYQNHNEYQRSKINNHGDLFIEISENAELDSIFPDDVINADDFTVGECRRSP